MFTFPWGSFWMMEGHEGGQSGGVTQVNTRLTHGSPTVTQPTPGTVTMQFGSGSGMVGQSPTFSTDGSERAFEGSAAEQSAKIAEMTAIDSLKEDPQALPTR